MIIVNSNKYRCQTGKNPRGYGNWAFQIGEEIKFFAGTYTVAKIAAAKVAKGLGITNIVVLP